MKYLITLLIILILSSCELSDINKVNNEVTKAQIELSEASAAEGMAAYQHSLQIYLAKNNPDLLKRIDYLSIMDSAKTKCTYYKESLENQNESY